MELLMAIIGAALYRLRGMNPKEVHPANILPRLLWKGLFVIPYALQVLEKTGSVLAFGVALILGVGLVSIAHGNSMDLATMPTRENEWYEFYRPWLDQKLSPFWTDFISLGVSGLILTVPFGILCVNPVIAISGFAKPIAYALGWKLGGKTESGELLTGAFLWGVL